MARLDPATEKNHTYRLLDVAHAAAQLAPQVTRSQGRIGSSKLATLRRAPGDPAETGNTAQQSVGSQVAKSDQLLAAACRQQFAHATARRRVNFRFDSSELQPSAYALLDALVEIAADCPGLRIHVTGHTDASGDPAHNQYLSERRAAAVRAYMVARGIRAGRLTANGMGASELLDHGTGRAARARNRRIEFELMAGE